MSRSEIENLIRQGKEAIARERFPAAEVDTVRAELIRKNGARIPKYYERAPFPAGYFDPVDPNNPPGGDIYFDLPALIAYARKTGKPIAELSKEEVDQFKMERKKNL